MNFYAKITFRQDFQRAAIFLLWLCSRLFFGRRSLRSLRLFVRPAFGFRRSSRRRAFVMLEKKTRRPKPTGTKQNHTPANRRARATANNESNRGSNPARHARDNTDGNGNAKHEQATRPDPSRPQARNQDTHTRRRAPTAERDRRKAAAPPADAGTPGTQADKPGHTPANGQPAPKHARRRAPGTQSQAATQQRQTDTANTSAEKSRRQRAPPDDNTDARGTHVQANATKPRRRPRNKAARLPPITAAAV